MGLVSVPILSRAYFMVSHIQLNILPYMGTFNWNITRSHVITSSSSLFPGKTLSLQLNVIGCLSENESPVWFSLCYNCQKPNPNVFPEYHKSVWPRCLKGGELCTSEIWPLFHSRHYISMCKPLHNLLEIDKMYN
jgi:hypothetical protein